MPITAQCPGCSTNYTVKEEMVGKSVKCKKCQTTFVIKGKAAPQRAAASAAPAAAVRGGRPPRPPVQEEAAVAVEENGGSSRPRKKDGLYKRSPQSNLVLVGICVGVCFVLFGTPIMLMSILASRAPTITIGGSGIQGAPTPEQIRKMQEDMLKNFKMP
jgi:predicted Zn finger-like uncharacterized protein